MAHDVAYEAIEFELDYPVATIRLNVPRKLNALTTEVRTEMMDLLERLTADDGVRAVILCGAGRAFSSGYDLVGGDSAGVAARKLRMQEGPAYWRAIWEFPKPIIAAVHGYCLGGACEIAMLCDLTIAAEGCKFGEPEIRFGMGATLVMPWYVPPKVAKQLLFTGSLIDADRAYQVGMVNDVVPADKLMDRARYYADLMSAINPMALRLTKDGINKSIEMMGFINSVNYHDNLVAMMFGTDTEESRAFSAVRDRDGLKAALAWRAQQFEEIEKTR